MSWLRTLLVCFVIGAIAAPVASAKPGGGGGGTGAAKRERIKKRILALRAWMLTDELSLDEATAGKLFPVLAKYDDQFEKLLREAAELRRKADDAAAASDDKALDTLIDEIVANQRARWDAEQARFQDVRAVLTPRQAARLLVVLPQIDKKILNRLRKAVGDDDQPARRPRHGGAPAEQPEDELDNPFR